MKTAPLVYPLAMRVLHWGTVALLLFSYAAAWSIEQAQSAQGAALLLMVHRSVGATLFLVTLVRLIVRLSSERPSLPADIPVWQRWGAHGNEFALYCLPLLQPALGFAASWLHGDRILLFGFISLQGAWKDRALSSQLFLFHGVVALLLLVLIGLHVGAALYHLVVRRDNVMSSMIGVRLASYRLARTTR
jgi:cytochrome b561